MDVFGITRRSLTEGINWTLFIQLFIVISILFMFAYWSIQQVMPDQKNGLIPVINSILFTSMYCCLYYLRIVYLKINKWLSLATFLVLFSNPKISILIGIDTPGFYDQYVAPSIDIFLVLYAMYFF